MELFWATVVAFFGALVGILYPPKSLSWARAQKFGIALLGGATIAWAAAYCVAIAFALRTALWVLIALGSGFFIAYLVVGNTCRKFHERD